METTEEYLSNLAGKKNVFKVPADYFEGLPERIHTEIINSDKAFNFSNDLNLYDNLNNGLKIDHETVLNFGLPNPGPNPAYFESLHSRIMSRIAGSSEVETFGISSNKFLSQGLETSVVEQNQVEFRDKIQDIKKIQNITRLNSKGSIISLWANPIVRFAAAASVIGLLVFTGLEIKTTIENKYEFARVAPEDRFLNRYDIDESVVEEELVSPVEATNAEATNVKDSLNTKFRGDNKHVSVKDHEKSDSYILEHADEHTLVEEI